MSVVCIIPARGGSKRIPDKNIRLFAGKPMVAHSILAAKASGLFDHVIVSTDSDAIAVVAQEWGAEVPFRRPAELANDFAGTDAVFLHGILEAEKIFGPLAYACCIYATAPLLRDEYLREGFTLLQEKRAATAFAVATYPAPIFRALRIDEHGRLAWHWPEFAMTRSQDLPLAVQDAGQFYWVDVPRFKRHPDTMNGDALPVLIPRHVVQDIDTPEDWEVAEKLFAAAQCPQVQPRQ
jgi:pseudaminic acid cytidylyltransferase